MIELQHKLLGDRVRNDAFFAALKKIVAPGKSTVSDIGSGTGFLSFLALKLGAKECFLYEEDRALLSLSKIIARQNRIKNCRFVAGYSFDCARPTKTDIVVAEVLGNHCLEEHIIETMSDAHRFLRPGGVLIPAQLKQFCAPLISEKIWRGINVWDSIGFELDFSFAREAALQNMYVTGVAPADLINDARCFDEMDFRRKQESMRSKTMQWKFAKSARVYGFCLWWEAVLGSGISLSTSPWEPATHWEQIILPLGSPLDIAAREPLSLELYTDTRFQVGCRVKWKAVSARQQVEMDTIHGIG